MVVFQACGLTWLSSVSCRPSPPLPPSSFLFLFPLASYQGRPIVLSLKLPALLHKFLEPLGSTLNSDTFFQKWNQLGGPPREVRQIIKAKEPVNPKTLREQVCCTVP